MKIGLVGVGHLGQHHRRLLREIPEVELVGCFDTDPEVQARERERGVTVFEKYDDLLAAADAVDLVVPTDEHYPLAKKALAQGKHIFLEKPITETVAQARELVDLAHSKNLILQVGHIERFNPAITALHDLDLQPRFIESHRLSQFQPRGTEVAVILDLMIHDIDIIMSLVKSPVAHIEASGVPVITTSIDIANARISFENGCVANVTASRISQKAMRKIRIFQPAAYISIDFLQNSTEIYRLRESFKDTDTPLPFIIGEMEHHGVKKQIVYEQPVVDETNPLRDELSAFVESIENGTQPIVSGEDGLRALEVAQMIQAKIQESSVM